MEGPTICQNHVFLPEDQGDPLIVLVLVEKALECQAKFAPLSRTARRAGQRVALNEGRCWLLVRL